MGTREEEEPTVTTADQFEGAFRLAVAGSTRGAVRRIVLYVVVALCVMLTTLTPFAALPAIGALMLLAMTDQLA